jgi:hypothetical protein
LQFIKSDRIRSCEATNRGTTKIREVGSPTHDGSEIGSQCADIRTTRTGDINVNFIAIIVLGEFLQVVVKKVFGQ